MAAPATEPQPEPYRLSDPEQPEPFRFVVDTIQQDPELRVIEASLTILRSLPYADQMRAVTYLRERIESDPAVWNTDEPRPAEPLVPRRDVAQVLAKSDGRDWDTMTPDHQSPYYRRAEALTSEGFKVVHR